MKGDTFVSFRPTRPIRCARAWTTGFDRSCPNGSVRLVGDPPRMAKRITPQKLIERAGIALIERRVSEMRFVWHERQNDFGIDGEIEFRDPKTESALNSVVFVQSKASDRPFPGETADGFHYPCREEDLAYWLGGNAPVLLVCSHPKSQEAWWVSIKDYFSTPERLASRRVDIDKHTQGFGADAAAQLLSGAVPKSSGLYFGPPPDHEQLVTNLVPLTSWPDRIYWVQTAARDAREVRQRLIAAGTPAMDWIRRDGRVYSFRDLSKAPFTAICDGPVGSMPTSTWATSDDAGERFRFVDLLKHTLQEQFFYELGYHGGRRFFYFRPTVDLQPRRIASGKSKHGVTVFKEYRAEDDAQSFYFRHHAAELRFVRVEDDWFCEILPTYHYTSDGRQDSLLESAALSGIKAQERNEAVRRLVELWAFHLRTRAAKTPKCRLRFGKLVRLDVELDPAFTPAYSEAA
jgi:hypothetical protein